MSTVAPFISGYSSRSSVETSSKVNHKATSMVQTSQMHSRSRRSKSLCQEDPGTSPVMGSFHPENASAPLTAPPAGSLRRSLSGTLAQDRGYWQEEELPYQYTYKGPSHRTISRITNRHQNYQQSGNLGQEGWVGNGRGFSSAGDSWGAQWQQHVSRASQVTAAGQYAGLHRAASLRSLKSVGKGVDVLDVNSLHSNDPLGE